MIEYSMIKEKKRSSIKPVGFIIGDKKIYLTTLTLPKILLYFILGLLEQKDLNSSIEARLTFLYFKVIKFYMKKIIECLFN